MWDRISENDFAAVVTQALAEPVGVPEQALDSQRTAARRLARVDTIAQQGSASDMLNKLGIDRRVDAFGQLVIKQTTQR